MPAVCVPQRGWTDSDSGESAGKVKNVRAGGGELREIGLPARSGIRGARRVFDENFAVAGKWHWHFFAFFATNAVAPQVYLRQQFDFSGRKVTIRLFLLMCFQLFFRRQPLNDLVRQSLPHRPTFQG